MPDSVKPRTVSDYPRRRQRALVTRRRVIEAARDLFIERGFVATTIDSIAARADVAPETIYSAFGNKRSLLAAVVDASIAGAVEARPILEQDWVQQMRDEPDARRRVGILAQNGAAILERRHAIDDVVTGAASSDPDIAALRELGRAQRHAGQRALLSVVAGSTALRKGLDLDTAADILYAIGSPETYRSLVIDLGWSAVSFEAWYGETVHRLLFDG